MLKLIYYESTNERHGMAREVSHKLNRRLHTGRWCGTKLETELFVCGKNVTHITSL